MNSKKFKKDLNELDGNKLSPLHYAAKYGKVEVARLLIKHGADIALVGDDGCLPIHFAVKYRPDVFADSNNSNNEPEATQPRLRAANTHDGFIDTLKLLIAAIDKTVYPDLISHDDAYGDAPLHYAVSRNNVAAARILLKHGADLNDLDNQNQTPLHMAATNGNVECLQMFIDAGQYTPSNADNDGTTAIQARSFFIEKFIINQKY